MPIVDDKNVEGIWIKSYSIEGIQHFTKSYQTWNAMNMRCKVGGSRQRIFKSYVGCTVEGSFKNFQLFTDWYVRQIGYDIKGYHLEKDILVEGNKVYSENTCCLVPPELNAFLLDSRKARGEFPQGVSFHKSSKKFRAYISIDGKPQHIGLYETSKEAEQAYKVAKNNEAQRWYQRLLNKEFLVDPRVIDRMRTWKFEKEMECDVWHV